MNDEWTRITEYSNWCWIDVYGGNKDDEVKDGDRLVVRWPTGEETEETVVLNTKSRQYSDMGKTYDGTCHKAQVRRVIHGIEVMLPISGFEVKRLGKENA